MDAGIKPQAVYSAIEKIATKGGDQSDARPRVYQFKADVAASDIEFGKATQLKDKLCRMLVIASKRHRRANVTVFKDAIDALDGKVGLLEWNGDLLP
jgi:hypothetical protein